MQYTMLSSHMLSLSRCKGDNMNSLLEPTVVLGLAASASGQVPGVRTQCRQSIHMPISLELRSFTQTVDTYVTVGNGTMVLASGTTTEVLLRRPDIC